MKDNRDRTRPATKPHRYTDQSKPRDPVEVIQYDGCIHFPDLMTGRPAVKRGWAWDDPYEWAWPGDRPLVRTVINPAADREDLLNLLREITDWVANEWPVADPSDAPHTECPF